MLNNWNANRFYWFEQNKTVSWDPPKVVLGIKIPESQIFGKSRTPLGVIFGNVAMQEFQDYY